MPQKKKHILQKLSTFLGIRFIGGRLWRIHIRPRFLMVLGGVSLLLLFFLAGLVKYSSSPSFCKSCHIMKPFYESWKTSTHNSVSCVKCHFPPGVTKGVYGKFQSLSQVVKYVTRTYDTKPHAEIEDASCLRQGCHEKRLLEGEVIFKKVKFDHRPHLLQLRRGKQLRCTSCHSQIVQGTHIEVTEQVCFICHFKDTKEGRELHPIGGCPSCHQAPEKPIKIADRTFNHADYLHEGVECAMCHINVIQGEGEVPRQICLTCHGEPEHLQYYNDSEFIHNHHVTEHKVECFDCHMEIKHQISRVKRISSTCDTCHIDRHGGQEELYMGTGGRGIPENPSAMYLAQVNCLACHLESAQGSEIHQDLAAQTLKAIGTACVTCHGEGYDELLFAWQEMLSEQLKEVLPTLQKAQEMLQVLTGEEKGKADLEMRLADAWYNYYLVKYGKGVHNIEYSMDLLSGVQEVVDEMIIALQEKSKEGN